MIKTAWDNREICDHILNTNFPPLSQSDHFDSLNVCINQIRESVTNAIDIGCCKAEFSDAFPDLEYCGADLPHIIENVSKKLRPKNEYIHLNASSDSMAVVSSFDLIVMNSFLSEMPEPLKTLHSVLTYAKKNVIIHRQDIIDGKTDLENYRTYGGLETVNSLINSVDLDNVVRLNNCHTAMTLDSYQESNTKKTILICKND